MGKEPLYGWNWGQAFLDEKTLEGYSYDKLKDLLKKNRENINHTLRYVFNFEWEGDPLPSRLNEKLDMVEDLLEYCHRIERVLAKRGYRARSVKESVSFERGEDPKKGLNIGRDRKVKKGDKIPVNYKGKEYIVTAASDESEYRGRVMTRSGGYGWGGREPEYESRTFKEVFVYDKNGNTFKAEAKEWWDNQGNTIWPWEIGEYEKPVLE
jgi:hypothetical protein